MARWLLSLLILFFTATPVLAQTGDDELAARAAALIEETGSPGAAIAVLDGQTYREGVAGLRIAGSQVPIHPGDLWHMGSNTKAMTATLAARLVEQGDIAWDSAIGEVLSGLDLDIHPELAPVTLIELLVVIAIIGLLVAVAVAYLLGGYVVFHSATRRARRLGVLGDY